MTAEAAEAAAGLSTAEAAERLRRDGPNLLPGQAPVPAWRRLGAEMVHFFALMLWAAGLLAIAAGMAQLGVAIFVVVVVNGLFAFVQEQRAERAAERLRELLPAQVRVRRDGRATTVPAADLVAGDAVLLEAGDRVPADVALTAADGLLVDESMLTGESVPAARGVADTVQAGTFVVVGDAEGTVVATAGRTRLAEIAHLTAEVERPPSPLSIEITRIVRTVAVVAVGVGVGFFGLALLVGTPVRDGFLFAIGVTVALVPEGLLPTVTLSLAMGAQRMAADNALVRHLEAVETLGSTTFICTDKTGTLTRNQMAVTEVWTPAGVAEVSGTGYDPGGEVTGPPAAVAATRVLAEAARACSRGRAAEVDGRWTARGDPMEAAIDALHRRASGEADPGEPVLAAHWPFDPQRRRESVLTGGVVLVKGAPDSVLDRCTGDTGSAREAMEDLAARGLRILAVARRPGAGVAADEPADRVETGLELLGLLAIQDPPRPEVVEALVTCRRAGIRVAMLTGDHPATARAIAAQIGLLGPDGLVVQGDELPADDDEMAELVDRDGIVLSRVTPEHKLRIAKALQRRGHVVAMTGDGVNDAPALREADIGVAMGRGGTDVAREAADLVLLDDNFATIVAAVAQGRATYANIRRFLTYHLTDNVAELTPFVVWALSGGRIPLAIGVLQILFLDIGTDLLPALALGAERANPEQTQRPAERRHIIDRALLRRVFLVLGPAEAVVEMAAFFTALMLAGWRPGLAFPTGHALAAASGAAFTAVIAGQAANGFACRSSSQRPGQLGWTSNRLLLAAVGVSAALLLVLLGFPPLARLLSHTWPPLGAWAVALAAAPAVLAADAANKWWRTRRRSDRDTAAAAAVAAPVAGPSR